MKGINEHIKRRRTKIQNTAAGVVLCAAEPKYAFQIALEQVEKSLSVMRFFSRFCIHPTSICFSAPIEKQHPDGHLYLIVREGRVVQESAGFSGGKLRSWNISNADQKDNWKSGLAILDYLLKKESRTDYEETLFGALDLYSNSALSKRIPDRLTYLLIALETLFLKDQSEDHLCQRHRCFF